MHFFSWIISCIIIASAIAVENFFDDSENISNDDFFLNGDQMPIDMLAMTDFSTPYSFGGQASLNPSESDDLAPNIISPEGTDPVLLAASPDECSTSIGNQRRIRRETFCSSQDSDSTPFDYSRLDWSQPSDVAMTDFDQQKCGLERLPSYLVCSAPDLSDFLTASLFALGGLEHCTRGICPYIFSVNHRRWWIFDGIVYNAEDWSKCVPPGKLYCCRFYSEFPNFADEERSGGQPLIVSVIRTLMFEYASCLTCSLKPSGMGSLCTPLDFSFVP